MPGDERRSARLPVSAMLLVMATSAVLSAGAPSVVVEAHALSTDRIATLLGTSSTVGLAADEAARRLVTAGPNELVRTERPTLPAIVLDAVTEPFVVLLFLAGLLAIALGEARDGLLVLAALLPIVGADVVTEYRSERALATLRDAAAPRARVRRGGRVLDCAARELVPGDIVLLRAGDVVPADIRVTAAGGLALDRSALTGESIPELAASEPDPAGALLVDRRSVAYAGTSVVSGRGEGIVVATGAATELGRIAGSLADVERRRSPLQRELDRLVRILLVVAAALIVVTMGLGTLRGRTLGENVLAGISAAIAAIPEEPPVLLAVILGLGAYRLLKRGVLVRRLSAQETLGAVDLILTDKTGTLTENRLALSEAVRPDGTNAGISVHDIIAAAFRAEEDAWELASGVSPGSFTRALADALGGVPALKRSDLIDAEGPTATRPYSRTRARRGGRIEELVLGAPEAVERLVVGDGADPEWRRLVDERADSGGRLLLLARRLDGDPWQPLALLAFADRIRDDVPAALRVARSAGIQTLVVTGDHPRTAAAIARAAGIAAEEVITGEELERWDDDRLRASIPHLDIVARAAPEQKLRLLRAARAIGRTVAVTGDGVNDAPALQHADVAVAVGSGTAVAREASDLVLGDDSFATLMDALREGRRIVANVQKGLVFLISTHVALLGFVLIATIAGFDQPLLPLQILWLELFIDLSTSVAFEREPEEPDAMRTAPRSRDRPLLDRSLLAKITLAGGFSAVAALLIMATHPGGPEHVRWVAFTALVTGQAVRAYANRSLSQPLHRLPANRLLLAACLVTVGVQAAIPYLPGVSDAFRATPLALDDWLLVGLVAFGPAVLAQVGRLLYSGRVQWVA